MYDVFISYGGPDEKFAETVCNRLRSAGVSVFFFKDSAEFSERLHNTMRNGITKARCVILICSESSLNRNGVVNEIEEALSREAMEGGRSIIIPIALDDYVFGAWSPPNPGIAQAIQQRVIGDFRKAKRNKKIFEVNFARLLAVILKHKSGPNQPPAEIYNFNPEIGRPDSKFGVSEWSRSPGRMSFIKWRDPGGVNYNPDYPYHCPNRVLTVSRGPNGKRQWKEYNLTHIQDGSNVWEGASHHWVEAEHDFSAIGNNRPGSIFFRKDIEGFPVKDGHVAVLEFFVPKDAVSLLAKSAKASIYMRWTSDLVGTTLEERQIQVGTVGFKETAFEISQIVLD